MPILLSHNSSLERLRSVPPQVDTSLIIQRPLDLDQFAKIGRAPNEEELRALGLLQRPTHVLVPSRKHAGKRAPMRMHRCPLKTIPAGLVRQVATDAYCSGPELTFVQMANETTPVGAAVLAYELCGTYSHFAQMVSGFYERTALTTVEKLGSTLPQLSGVRGVTSAREALRWVRDKSASPMETVIACMLSFPTKMGGYGMVLPELNFEVALDEAEAAIAGSKLLRIDTAYPQVFVGVEFDGKAYHRDPAKDRARRDALAHKGWTIYVFDVDELVTFSKFKEKVALLDAIPRRRGETEPDEKDAEDLLKRLLVATRFGVGMNAALFGTRVPRGIVKVHM